MKPLKIAGFTIIETMLFLGISGLLVMVVLVGTGSAINTQRYRDSVTSLQSLLQQQYSEVANVINNTSVNTCGSENNIPRGQSQCVVLGRYITTKDDGSTLIVRDVIGQPIDINAEMKTDDVEVLKQYTLSVLPTADKNYTVEWGSLLKNTNGTTNSSLSMLILRSPSSGVIRTFINNTSVVADDKLTSDLLAAVPSALMVPAELCVQQSGLFTGSKMAVQINANSTNASGIETLGEQNQSGNSICH